MHIRTVLAGAIFAAAVLAAAVPAPAGAQSLPRPVEFYFDADANATKPVIAVRDSGDGATEKLLRAIKRDPGAKAEHAQLAHLAMAGGRHDLGRELYVRALARIDSNDGLWRAVMWNYGWDLYRSGDAAGALAQWQELLAARAVAPSWAPPTLALVLWKLDRKDEARQWYAAAVRTEPALGSGSDRYPQLLPEWRDDERATLALVQAAWAAQPPRWP